MGELIGGRATTAYFTAAIGKVICCLEERSRGSHSALDNITYHLRRPSEAEEKRGVWEGREERSKVEGSGRMVPLRHGLWL